MSDITSPMQIYIIPLKVGMELHKVLRSWLRLPFVIGLLGLVLVSCGKIEDVVEKGVEEKPLRVLVRRTFFGMPMGQPVQEKSYHFNGHIKQVAELKDGKFHGSFEAFFMKGGLRLKGKYEDGKKTGEWEQFYAKTRVLNMRDNYQNGLKEGDFEFFWPNGKLREKGQFSADSEIGEWKSWDIFGNLVGINSCFSTNDSGNVTRWSPKNQQVIYQVKCIRGKKNGRCVEYYPNGKRAAESFYQHGLLQDSAITWDESGRVTSFAIFDKGTGVWNRYDSLGHITEKVSYQDGNKQGDNWEYDKNGHVTSWTLWEQNQPVKIRKWFSTNPFTTKPVVQIEGDFLDGKRHGLWVWYNMQGVVIEDALYQKGEKHGPNHIYNAVTGKPVQTIVYVNGHGIRGYIGAEPLPNKY